MEKILRNYIESINNLVIEDHHLVKKHQIFSLNKLNTATLYEILIDAKPTSQTHFENLSFRILSLTGEAFIYYLDV